MKRLVLILSVIMIMVGMCVPVLAQPSISIDGVVSVQDGKGKDGSIVQIIIESLNKDEQDLVEDILKGDSLKHLLGTGFSEKLQLIDAIKIRVLDGKGNELSDKKKGKLLPAYVTFNVPGVTPNSNVKVLYYENGKWNVASDVKLGNGTVSGTFNEGVPVIFLTEGKATMVSPQTGYNSITFIMALLSVASLTTIIVLRKRQMA